MQRVRRIIIPAAGLGSRFSPITGAIPKEMLPLFNKPALHYVLQEALESYIEQIIIITNPKKKVLQDYLEQDNTGLKLSATKVSYVYQHKPLGLGHAIFEARSLIQQNYFGIMLPDDLFISPNAVLKDLIDIAQLHQVSVIGVQRVPDHATCSYGIIGIKEHISTHLCSINHIVEKPSLGTAPSNLAVVGRYVLCPTLFDHLAATGADKNGEIQLTHAIDTLLKNDQPVYAYIIPEHRYDIGTPTGWFSALLHYALQRPEYADIVEKIMHNSLIPTPYRASL